MGDARDVNEILRLSYVEREWISLVKSFVKIDNRATLPNSACPFSPIQCPSWLPLDDDLLLFLETSIFLDGSMPCTNRFFPGTIKIFPQPLTSYAYPS